MKLLYSGIDRPEMENDVFKLRRKGIPSLISGIRGGITVLISDKYTLWAYLDEHYEDAIAVLNNSDHEVENPIDVVEFENLLENEKKAVVEKNYDKLMLGAVIAVIVCFGFGLWIYF